MDDNNYTVAAIEDGHPVAFMDPARNGQIWGPWNGDARFAVRLTEAEAERSAKEWRKWADAEGITDRTFEAVYLPTYL